MLGPHDDALFELTPRERLKPGDRVMVETLWGEEPGVVSELVETIDHYVYAVVAINGQRYSIDAARCHLQQTS